ncbi:MAG: DHH family phosphoesterase [Planctomycetota bacterium]|jgi:nanoRNase/pAp phosphatase (c-di-AMP/oligoRNAs hydrolase)
MTGNERDNRLLKLLDAVRGRQASLIQVHNNPDPDAIASAMGMRQLYQRYLNVKSRIVFGGIVGRAENRSMLRTLSVEIVPASKVDYGECDLLTMVDAQPGFGHAPLPDDRIPEVVVDHHPPRERPDGVLYWDVGRPVGATSTIVAQYFLRNGVPLPRDVATALMYGVKSDTHDLSENATEQDLEVYQQLFSYADTWTLAQIEKARVPRSYFAIFERAIENARVYDFACVSHLGKIDNPDMVAEMADFLLRCEDLRWTMVTGIYGKTLHLSLRSSGKNAHAGSVARKAVGVMGDAGGHGRMAGGQIPLGEADKRTREEVVQAVTDLFLEAVKAKRTLTHTLVDGTLLEETDTTEVPQ